MTGNTNKMIKTILLTMLLGCGSADKDTNTVRLALDPLQPGWYFVKLEKDSVYTIQSAPLQLDSNTRLVKAAVTDVYKSTVTIYDKAGRDISSQMKLVSLHESGEGAFFEFYNPSGQDMKKVKNWNVNDPEYTAIRRKGYELFRSLTKKQ